MSEERPSYVRCASGNNTFTDCLVIRAGDLIRLIGHAQMDFTAEDAKNLAYRILDMVEDPCQDEDAKNLAYRILDMLEDPCQKVRPLIVSPSGDAIVDEVMAMLLARSKLGQEKYGTTLMRNDLTLLDWMRHAIEESLDRTLYMLRALKDLEQLYDDGR